MAKKTIIRHIQGNRIEIRLPLSKLTATTTDGNADRATAPFSPSDLIIRLYKRGIARYELQPEVSENYVSFIDNGNIQLGEYAIELLCKERDITPLLPMRYKRHAFLFVVDDTEDGGIYDSNEYDIIAYYPVVEGREHAIVIDGNKVYMEVGGHFGEDDDPTDNKATIFTGYGEGQIVIENNKVILEI